ncbi:MAG: radical SAM family heme chaperone HemW [Elusimicrobiota bacterium]
MPGLYIHIPFCKRKCHYCDFCSYENLSAIEDYLNLLEKEAEIKKEFTAEFETVYIGGGTPSVLNENEIEKLFSVIRESFKLSKNAEITFEANPESLNLEKAKLLYDLGANRLSLGAQSFDDNNLSYLGRLSSSSQFILSFERAKKAGFKNISVDLIYGIPGTTVNNWIKDLKKATSLEFNHISCYCLEIYENTPLGKKKDTVSEEEQEKMFFASCEILNKAGFDHYEISNFAKKGFASKHNLNYWLRGDYLGLGISAASCLGRLRTVNEKDFSKYRSKIEKNKEPYSFKEKLSENDVYREKLMLALRLKDGIEYEGDIFIKFKNKMETAFKKGLLEIEGGKVRIKEKFWFISNSIISEIIF